MTPWALHASCSVDGVPSRASGCCTGDGSPLPDSAVPIPVPTVTRLIRLPGGSRLSSFRMLSRTPLLPSGFIGPCLPSPAERPPTGPQWIHEIKHDGYRLMARREAAGVRLLTRNGHDWASRFPLIVEAVNHLTVRSCLVDGEA